MLNEIEITKSEINNGGSYIDVTRKMTFIWKKVKSFCALYNKLLEKAEAALRGVSGK